MPDLDRLAASVPLVAGWFSAYHRPLPWREEQTPYHVWLSEVMLQQTRIEAVIPYYLRFLSELPDIPSLAAVEDDRLMKLWQGLGYYSRARNLKRAAEVLVRDFGGEMPASFDDLRRLPGIGDYTAGAIASIAFGAPEPAVDGNVLRVLSRLLASASDIADPNVKKRFAAALRAVYPTGSAASAFTQGLMELGETVCIPNGAPRCEECPLRELCLGKEEGEPTKYPYKSPKRARRVEPRTVFLYTDGKRFALRQRGEGLLAGLYEFPGEEGAMDLPTVKAFLSTRGVPYSEITPLGECKHIFTHIEWRMTGYLVKIPDASALFGLAFYTKDEIFSTLAVPSAFSFFLKVVRDL